MRLSAAAAPKRGVGEPPTKTPSPVKLRKKLREVHLVHIAHTRGVGHPVFVFAHVVPVSTAWIGEDAVRFYNEFEFLFVSTLEVRNVRIMYEI